MMAIIRSIRFSSSKAILWLLEALLGPSKAACLDAVKDLEEQLKKARDEAANNANLLNLSNAAADKLRAELEASLKR